MGEDRVQPTPIPEQEYEAFKQFVRDVHGKERGHLSSEIVNALREYRERHYGGSQLQRIEEDLATIKQNVVETESDGAGVVATPVEPSDTPTRESDRPAPNQPRRKKVNYLKRQYYDRVSCTKESGKLVRDTVETVVSDEYSFNEGTREEITDAVFRRIRKENNARPHPVHGNYYVWGDELEAAKEEARQQADDELDEVAA